MLDSLKNSVYPKLGNALILRKEKRLSDKLSALTIFKEISDEDEIYTLDRILVKKYQCELLLVELKITGEPEVLNEIRETLDQIYEIAKKQFSFPNIVEAMILSSKLSIVEGQVQEARSTLQEAQELVAKNKLYLLENVVNKELATLDRDYSRLLQLVESTSSIKERIIQSQIENYFSQAMKIVSEEE